MDNREGPPHPTETVLEWTHTIPCYLRINKQNHSGKALECWRSNAEDQNQVAKGEDDNDASLNSSGTWHGTIWVTRTSHITLDTKDCGSENDTRTSSENLLEKFREASRSDVFSNWTGGYMIAIYCLLVALSRWLKPIRAGTGASVDPHALRFSIHF